MSTDSKAVSALLGIAGGAAGMMAMQAVKRGAQRTVPADSGAGRPEAPGFVRTRHRRGEDATVALGRILFTTLFRREPGGREKQLMGTAVHWGYGLAMAAGYGMIRGRSGRPMGDLAGGALFGLGLWGVSDELLAPLLGIGDRPGAVPARVHVQALASHLGYGVATAATIQGLGRVLGTLESRAGRGVRRWPRGNSHALRERLSSLGL